MGHRTAIQERALALARRQAEAVGRMDLDLLEWLTDERLTLARTAARGQKAVQATPGAECASEAASAEELRRLDQQLSDRLDQQIRECFRELHRLTGQTRATRPGNRRWGS